MLFRHYRRSRSAGVQAGGLTYLFGVRDIGVRVDPDKNFGGFVVNVVGQESVVDGQDHGRPVGKYGRKVTDGLPARVILPVVDVDEPVAARALCWHQRQKLHVHALDHIEIGQTSCL